MVRKAAWRKTKSGGARDSPALHTSATFCIALQENFRQMRKNTQNLVYIIVNEFTRLFLEA